MKHGALINRFKYENQVIEVYKRDHTFYAVLNNNEFTKRHSTVLKAFDEAFDMIEGYGVKISRELKELSKKIQKVAMNPAQLIRKIEKDIEATLDDAYVTQRSLPGSYHYPPEPGEIEVRNAYIEKFPELSIDEAEHLPNRFECTVSETFREDEEEADVRLYFEVSVTSKNIKPNGKVEIEFTDRFVGWDYDWS